MKFMDLPKILSPAKRLSVYSQIEAALRASILNGRFSHGLRLPSFLRLAEHYETSVCTIQAAVRSLAKEGLLESRGRHGTFVVGGDAARLRNVGIYFGREFLHGGEMAFYRELYEKLVGELRERDVQHELWADSRPLERLGEPMPELAAAVSRASRPGASPMQGIIVCLVNPEEMAWLEALGIPLTVFGTPQVPFRVGFDAKQMMEMALADLKRQGCRTVGAIFPMAGSYHGPLETKVADDVENFFRSFVDCVSDLGLETHNSWVRVPDHLLANDEYENYGYREFQAIWKQPQRPDGLLIYPDTTVRGCITAMLHAGVSTPEQLKLVLHRNVGVPIICPLEASWLVSDPGAVAGALVGQLQRQIAGESVKPLFLPQMLESTGNQ